MHRFLRDDKNIYIMSLVYTDGAVPYSHIQLRNTVEYSDFANIKTLRNKGGEDAVLDFGNVEFYFRIVK